ncbi:MAG: hypothetical protein RR651_09905 [Lysinibacillus sp.]
MGNVYGAQHVASYLVYEINESHGFINNMSLQHLLSAVESKWQQTFGHSAFKEAVYTANKGYAVKEVFEAYAENAEAHIKLPAKEYYLKYGTFQLVERTYAIPNFTVEEQQLVQWIIATNHYKLLKSAS